MKTKTLLALAATSAGLILHAEFKAGFVRVDMTPPIGTELSGYPRKRVSDGIIDPLDINAVAFSDGTNKAVVISADVINFRAYFDLYRKNAAKAAGLSPEAVFIACTHTHTGPHVGLSYYGKTFDSFAKASTYERFVGERLKDAVKLSLADLAPAKLSIGRGEAKNISFIRRYRMKDGSCRTNPGRGNKDIVAPVGTPDEMVQLVRIDREGRDAIALVNFQCHPDTIGGNKISADWPRVVRETVERVLDGVKCIFVNGAQGDSNHVCVDLARKDVAQGRDVVYRHMGRVVAGAAIGLWDVCEPVPAGKVGFGVARRQVKSHRPAPEEIPEAQRIVDLIRAGKQSEVPGSGMQRVTNMAAANRKINLKDGPDFFDFPLSAVTVGETLAFVGFPGEPFTAYGKILKEKSPFRMTVPACIVNGSFGYLPTDEALRETGYETQGSLFVPGLEQAIVSGHLEQLNRLFEAGRVLPSTSPSAGSSN